jgi:hypothetical protein
VKKSKEVIKFIFIGSIDVSNQGEMLWDELEDPLAELSPQTSDPQASKASSIGQKSFYWN